MDGEPSALHASEPGHLAFGKLVDGYLQPLEHLVVGGLSCDILRHELVLQSVVRQVFDGNAFVEQSSHLLHHTVLQTVFQPSGNLLATVLAVDVDADNQAVHGRQFALGRGVFQVVGFYLDGTDGALTGVHIRRVVHVRARSGLQLLQHGRQFCQRVPLQACPDLWVLGDGRQLVTFQHGLDVQSCASTENGRHTSAADVLIGVEEVLLILEQVVLRSWLADVDEVVGDFLSGQSCEVREQRFDFVVLQVLARADVHAAIHLTRIGRDNLGSHSTVHRRKGCCQCCCQGCLAAGRRTEYGNHLLHYFHDFQSPLQRYKISCTSTTF